MPDPGKYMSEHDVIHHARGQIALDPSRRICARRISPYPSGETWRPLPATGDCHWFIQGPAGGSQISATEERAGENPATGRSGFEAWPTPGIAGFPAPFTRGFRGIEARRAWGSHDARDFTASSSLGNPARTKAAFGSGTTGGSHQGTRGAGCRRAGRPGPENQQPGNQRKIGMIRKLKSGEYRLIRGSKIRKRVSGEI